jgi:hypothetical protein
MDCLAFLIIRRLAAAELFLPAQKPAQNTPQPARNPVEMREPATYLQ